MRKLLTEKRDRLIVRLDTDRYWSGAGGWAPITIESKRAFDYFDFSKEDRAWRLREIRESFPEAKFVLLQVETTYTEVEL